MERWSNKIAIVTGASSGIGWAIVKQLLMADMQVIGLARRLQQMEELRSSLAPQYRDKYQPRECDVASLSSIKTAFHWIGQKYAYVNVLINNAGIAERSFLLDDGNEDSLKRTMDVNLMGAIYCTKEAYKLMQLAMQADQECHIININSLLGHVVPPHIAELGFNVYPVSKYALRATNEMLRRELFQHKLMRLSNLSPGLTRTNFGENYSKNDEMPHMQDPKEILTPDDVARGVMFVLSSPLHVTIAELVMVPSREKY